MRVIEENETEIYIELEDSDLPYEMPISGKNVYVRFKPLEGDFQMARVWKSKEELLSDS